MWMVLQVDDERRELSYRGRVPNRFRVVVASVGTALVVAYALVGSLQVLVWNPLAAVPGLTLPEIHAELDRVGQSFSATRVILWAVLGVSVATLLAASTLRPNGLALSHVAFAYSLLLVGGAPSLFCVAFLPGMQLADGFGTAGGDHSPWARPLFSTSFLAMIVAIATASLVIKTSRRRTPGPQAYRDV